MSVAFGFALGFVDHTAAAFWIPAFAGIQKAVSGDLPATDSRLVSVGTSMAEARNL